MFDFDASKLIVIGIAALILIGPKDLPRVLRQVGQFIGKMRRMAGEFQQQFSDAMRESELQELKKDMEKMAEDAKVDVNYDAFHDAEREIRESLEKKPEASTAQAGKPAIQNPTPENDPDSAFAHLEIPPASEAAPAVAAIDAKVHAPVREVGLDPEPVASEQTKARRA